jgi:hypothetical protein
MYFDVVINAWHELKSSRIVLKGKFNPMKKLFGVFCLVFFASCEKDIDLDLKNAEDVLVVDANIENERPPIVILTKSMDFFSSLTPELLTGSFVHDAEVTISNGQLTHRLKEYSRDAGGGIILYAYSIDSANLSTAFLGAFNTAYTLTITAGGKDYTAHTTIPPLTKKPDSLWWKPAPYSEDTTNIILMARTTDPPGLGNYIRYFTSKNNGPFLPGENSGIRRPGHRQYHL